MPFPPRSGRRQGLPGLRRLVAASAMLGLVVAGAMPSVGVGELDLVPSVQSNPEAEVVSTDLEVPATLPAVAQERRGGQRGAEMRAQARPEQADEPGDVVAALTRESTAEFGMVGVSWAAGTAPDDLAVEVRVRTEGTWGSWDALEVEDIVDQGMVVTREGTSPVWTGWAEGVDVRLRSADAAPEDVELTLIDGGTGLAVEPAGAALTSTTTSGTLVPRPPMRTRAQWGVDSSTESSCSSPTTASTSRGVTLHHTAGSNGYRAEDAPGIMRGMHRYHTATLGWCDIGYNFVVDAYGVIYVGRRGGPDKQVRGAHAGNSEANTYFTGISMMGNYETARLTTAMKSSVVKLMAWRLNSFGLDPHGTSRLGGKNFPVIHGHRDIRLAGIYPSTATACPGRYGVAWLGSTLRDEVAAEIAAAPADPTMPREAEPTEDTATPERVPSKIRALVRPKRTIVAGRTAVRLRTRVWVGDQPAGGRVVVRHAGRRLAVEKLDNGFALLRIGRFAHPRTHQVRVIHPRTKLTERTVRVVDIPVVRP